MIGLRYRKDGHSGSEKLQMTLSSPPCRGSLELPEIVREPVISPLPDAVIGAADQGDRPVLDDHVRDRGEIKVGLVVIDPRSADQDAFAPAGAVGHDVMPRLRRTRCPGRARRQGP